MSEQKQKGRVHFRYTIPSLCPIPLFTTISLSEVFFSFSLSCRAVLIKKSQIHDSLTFLFAFQMDGLTTRIKFPKKNIFMFVGAMQKCDFFSSRQA